MRDELSQLLRDVNDWSGTWTGIGMMPVWGDVTFHIEPDEDGPRRTILETLQAILAYPHDIRPAIEQAIYQLYVRLAPYDTVDFGEDDQGRDLAEVFAPRMTDSSQIWQTLTLKRIEFSEWENDAERANFQMHFAATWDREHGVKVEVERWQILKID